MTKEIVALGVEVAEMVARGDDGVDAYLASRAFELFGADGGVGVTRWSLRGDGTPVAHRTTGGIPSLTPQQTALAKAAATRSPSVHALLRAGERDAVRVSDALDLQEFWRTDEFACLHGLTDGRYPLGAALLQRPDEVIFIGLQRTRRDFDDADVENLRLLQAMLRQAFALRRILDDALERVASVSTTPLPRGTLPWLSPVSAEYVPTRREGDVLALVAAGWTNGQIAKRLGITERTVRKHLSSIYEKADVRGRAAAAAWWQECSRD